jgi:integrase
MLGLKKDNIDLINKKITGAGIKTEAGKDREIPIHSYLLPIFKKALLSNTIYLFAATEKSMLRPEHYRTRYFQPLMEHLGMNHSPHECRHTTASLLVRNQVPPELAKYILGHAQYSTTMDIYNHPQDNDLLKAVNKL